MIGLIADICSGELGFVHREIGAFDLFSGLVCSVLAPAFCPENSSVYDFLDFLVT